LRVKPPKNAVAKEELNKSNRAAVRKRSTEERAVTDEGETKEGEDVHKIREKSGSGWRGRKQGLSLRRAAAAEKRSEPKQILKGMLPSRHSQSSSRIPLLTLGVFMAPESELSSLSLTKYLLTLIFHFSQSRASLSNALSPVSFFTDPPAEGDCWDPS
jgi:hypothetical protein